MHYTIFKQLNTIYDTHFSVTEALAYLSFSVCNDSMGCVCVSLSGLCVSIHMCDWPLGNQTALCLASLKTSRRVPGDGV